MFWETWGACGDPLWHQLRLDVTNCTWVCVETPFILLKPSFLKLYMTQEENLDLLKWLTPLTFACTTEIIHMFFCRTRYRPTLSEYFWNGFQCSSRSVSMRLEWLAMVNPSERYKKHNSVEAKSMVPKVILLYLLGYRQKKGWRGKQTPRHQQPSTQFMNRHRCPPNPSPPSWVHAGKAAARWSLQRRTFQTLNNTW